MSENREKKSRDNVAASNYCTKITGFQLRDKIPVSEEETWSWEERGMVLMWKTEIKEEKDSDVRAHLMARRKKAINPARPL